MDVDSSQGSLRGSKTFKTVLVPETPGKKTIGTIGFSFFDPGKNKYISLKSSPISVDVKPAQGGISPQYFGPVQAASEIKVINRDIEYLKSLKKWKNYRGPIYKNIFFILFSFLPIVILAASLLYLRWTEKIASDVSFARRLRASKTARKYLKQAKSLMNTETSHDFYSAVSRSLLEYIAHKLNVSPEGLTLAVLDEKLLQKNVRGETVSAIKNMLEECDMVRFSPGERDGRDDKKQLHERRETDREARKGTEMKKNILLLFIVLSASLNVGAVEDYLSKFNDAAKLYENAQYSKAIDAYEIILSSGQRNAALYYNLGNAYYKNGKIGKAVLNYERAKRLRPQDPAIRYNLSFLQRSLQETEPSLFDSVLEWCTGLVSINKAAIFTSVSFALFIFVVIFFLFTKSRAAAFISLAPLALFLVFGMIFALQYRDQELTKWAVVISSRDARNGPGAENSVAFSLPEGKK